MEASRAKEMLTSPQLTLGELILKLEAVKYKALPIVFDDGKYKPTGLGSWRGSYRELSICYEDGGQICYDQPLASCKRDDFGDHDYKCPCGGSKEYSTSLPTDPKAEEFLEKLKLCNGKVFQGWKGGDFTMGKTTPVWVANEGTSSGFDTTDDTHTRAVVDVIEDETRVRIITKLLDY